MTASVNLFLISPPVVQGNVSPQRYGWAQGCWRLNPRLLLGVAERDAAVCTCVFVPTSFACADYAYR